MAEVLEFQQLLANSFEPKTKFRWILSIDGIDAFVAKTSTRPQKSFDEIVIDYVNDKRFLAGKHTPQPITLTLHDPITPSASQKVEEWLRLAFEAQTGRMGYSAFYKKNFFLHMLDPVGQIVEEWEIQGAWPQEVNYGDLDYAAGSEPAEISVTIRYDHAILNY